MKKLSFTQRTEQGHWVGDGFPVRTVFSYNDIARRVTPFLLLDYAGPAEFKASPKPRGVGEHPHRGFETVTIAYAGEVSHRDSAGGGGLIGPGDVQWMTAASGLVHEEMHGPEFSKKGGAFEMVQLWVNLPAKDKMGKPGYQGLKDADIPRVDLPDGAGYVRVIAGDFNGSRGAARTHTPMNVWDVRLKAGGGASFTVPEGHTASIFVLSGSVQITGSEEILGEASLGVLEREGNTFELTALEDTKLLFLGGEPINEPIVGYGPFVMNTASEIQAAMRDYQEGRMGHLAETA